jgi:hypothetical protein
MLRFGWKWIGTGRLVQRTQRERALRLDFGVIAPMLNQEFDPAVAAAVQVMEDFAIDEPSRLHLQKVLARPETQLLAREGETFLFRMQTQTREDYPEYQFFVLGQLIELRRIGLFSDRYSFVNFPPALEDQRHWVQDRFAVISLSTEDGLGWFAPGPWDQLGEAQQAICKPKFIRDNVTGFTL